MAGEAELERTLFKVEREGQERFGVIEDFWQGLVEKPGSVVEGLEKLPFEAVRVPMFPSFTPFKLGIEVGNLWQPKTMGKTEFVEWLKERVAEGWKLHLAEFRHIQFGPSDEVFLSRIYLAVHCSKGEVRGTLDGEIFVLWKGNTLAMIHGSDLRWRRRIGSPAFVPDLALAVAPPKGSYFIDPLLTRDLDRDGKMEVILAAANKVLTRRGANDYAERPLVGEDLRLIFTAAIADFTGDQIEDLVTARFEGIYLYPGQKGGTFGAGKLVWQASPRLTYGQALTWGDIDKDGDNDLFLGQYKPPFSLGQMPTPYYAANDGAPWFLLRNGGTGNFADITSSAGLGEKRWRRLYSASLVDLDGDDDLDLLTVSDFAGLDAFKNVQGSFSDATSEWFASGGGFGMSHLLTDLNGDSKMDVLMIAMNSPTADRLDALKIVRPGVNDGEHRKRMTHGNRAFLRTEAGYAETNLGEMQRTGWSWGSAATDLDGDGLPDIYITNGHESKRLVKEYEPEFWLHDVYVADSQTNIVAAAYFQQKMKNTRAMGYSYGGYEINRLYLSDGGTNYVEAAHLLGVASQADSRNTTFVDLDGDGAEELIYTTFEVWPETRQMIYIYRNTLPARGSKPMRSNASGNGYRTN